MGLWQPTNTLTSAEVLLREQGSDIVAKTKKMDFRVSFRVWGLTWCHRGDKRLQIKINLPLKKRTPNSAVYPQSQQACRFRYPVLRSSFSGGYKNSGFGSSTAVKMLLRHPEILPRIFLSLYREIPFPAWLPLVWRVFKISWFSHVLRPLPQDCPGILQGFVITSIHYFSAVLNFSRSELLFTKHSFWVTFKQGFQKSFLAFSVVFRTRNCFGEAPACTESDIQTVVAT